MSKRLIQEAVAKIDALIIERGGQELGEVSLHALEAMLTKLVADCQKKPGVSRGSPHRSP
jgi:hypothetical protein